MGDYEDLQGALLDSYKLGRSALDNYANELRQARDNLDFSRLVATLRQELPDLASMSDGTVHALLAGLYQTDPRTRAAWDSRYQAGGPSRWKDQSNRIMATLYADLSKRPDSEASATAAAVTAAVMRGGGITPRELVMPDLNKLTDREFAAFKKTSFGFDSRG